MEPDKAGAWVLFEDIAPPAGWEDDLDAALRASQAMNAQLVAALRGLEAMAERYRQPGAPMPDAQKAARAALAADSVIELTALSQDFNDARSASSA